MYLAILAGGQMIKKMAMKTMKLPKDKGTAIFDIHVPNRGTFRTEFKKTIDSISLTPEQREMILKEAPQVFYRNNQVVKSHGGTGRYLLKYFVLICMIGMILYIGIRKLW